MSIFRKINQSIGSLFGLQAVHTKFEVFAALLCGYSMAAVVLCCWFVAIDQIFLNRVCFDLIRPILGTALVLWISGGVLLLVSTNLDR